MIKSVGFHNFKALRDTSLPLEPFTLLIGPNGSGKSTAIQAVFAVTNTAYSLRELATMGIGADEGVWISLELATPFDGCVVKAHWTPSGKAVTYQTVTGTTILADQLPGLNPRLKRMRRYSLDPANIANPMQLVPSVELAETGGGLACVLDRLRDDEPERFEALNEELARWLPEFDRVLFSVPSQGSREFLLRTKSGHHSIPAKDLSHGTVLALAILTLAYLPSPPSFLCLEDPDRGIHPRLLREIQDAFFRLAYPERFGEKREPVQVLVTTHSPYLLDLYKDHPEQIVISHKTGNEARFERLSNQAHIEEILEGASLGEIWYSGVLGGVP